jgi:hypothetical protein
MDSMFDAVLDPGLLVAEPLFYACGPLIREDGAAVVSWDYLVTLSQEDAESYWPGEKIYVGYEDPEIIVVFYDAAPGERGREIKRIMRRDGRERLAEYPVYPLGVNP